MTVASVPSGIANDMFRYRAAWVAPFGAVNEAEFALNLDGTALSPD
jgi:hypothetical protein